VVFANRSEGSGTRVLLDSLIATEGIPADAINGYGTFMDTHFELALSIRQDRADAGLGIEAAAVLASLDFIPLKEESYDLVILNEHLDIPPVQKLLDYLPSPAFRRLLGKMAGYNCAEIGSVLWEGKVTA
jgi:putative molybdopterin biosynthesis protein